MNRFSVDGYSLAYRDEGSGPVVVFVHGTPSSSAEFAAVIAALRGSFRCIAIDHLGFGESDKPAVADYSIAAQRARLSVLLGELGVRDFHLVVHDFGGAIALPLALEEPGRVVSLTLMNTWLWPLEETEATLVRQKWLLQSAMMRFCYRYLNFSARVLVKAAWGTHRPLTREHHAAYMRRFPRASDRTGTIAFLNALFDRREPAWRADVSPLRAIPTLVLWGAGDALITVKTLKRWTELLPDGHVVQLPRVGHFLADEAPHLVVDALRPFLGDAASARSRRSA